MRAVRAGVKVAFGSDEYYDTPGRTRGQASLLTLQAYQEAGMSPLEVLREATVNSATLLGWGERIGSIEAGKLADLVLWKPAFFGAKPSLVLKGGMIAMAAMGDPSASIPTPQPVHYRPMFGAYGSALAVSCVNFVSQASIDAGIADKLGLHRPLSAVRATRTIGKRDMVLNGATPTIDVDAQTYEVRADGVLLTCEPASVLPLAQRYFLF